METIKQMFQPEFSKSSVRVLYSTTYAFEKSIRSGENLTMHFQYNLFAILT